MKEFIDKLKMKCVNLELEGETRAAKELLEVVKELPTIVYIPTLNKVNTLDGVMKIVSKVSEVPIDSILNGGKRTFKERQIFYYVCSEYLNSVYRELAEYTGQSMNAVYIACNKFRNTSEPTHKEKAILKEVKKLIGWD